MPVPSTTDELIALVLKSELLPRTRLDEYVDRRRAENTLPGEPLKLAQHLVHDGLLTKYQAEQLLGGRYRNFVIGGKYKLLERLGKGGMALVFLCEHQVMKRLVALKILPTAHAEDRELLGRFHREARALSQLRHPNIVGAYDVDHANKVHFLVMEYVDGGDLDVIVQRSGPLPFERAAHYIRQAAQGLQHAHECGLIHRDIKPGNLLVDRAGTVKLLDLGLARIFHETTDDLTTGRDVRTLLGTVDYLAPEQALDSHDVDIRADIYGLGATFYFLLTGKGLFEDGTVAQKLSWHLHRPPVPITQLRPDVPAEMIRVLERMLAKKPEDRYQTPEEVVEALASWTMSPIAPPSPSELPQLSMAARGSGQLSGVQRMVTPSTRSVIAPQSPIVESPPSKATQLTSSERIAVEEPPAPKEPTPGARPSAIEAGPVVRTSTPRLRKLRRFAGLAGALLLIGAVGWWVVNQLNGGEPSVAPVDRNPSSVKSSPPETSEVGSNRPGLTRAPSADQVADATFSLSSATAGAKTFPSLREAIRAAKAGDRVLVRGRLMTEAIEISDVEGVPKNLTIQADEANGRAGPVWWRAPRDLAQGRSLLDVSGLEGFRLKGFVFDGQGRVPELIRLAGRGPGSTLEDLRVQGASRAGLVIRGWAGEASRPAILRKVGFSTDREIDAAIMFEADRDRPSGASDSIRIDSCRFVGPFQSAILVVGSVTGLEVEQSRFYKATDGLRYRKSENREPLRARLASNTFLDIQRGVHFETTPPADSSELVMTNNVFANTPRLATLDKVSVQPSTVFGRWIWTEEGRKTAVVAPGARYFRKVFDLTTVPEKARLDVSCDETFTVWLNGSEVGKDPSTHYTQRVFTFEVANRLRRGRNVLAILGTNQPDRLDSHFGTTAGLLAQVTTPTAGREVALVRTDETWKWAEQVPEGWNRAEFDDHAWKPVRPWTDTGATWPWIHAVWESTVLPQLKPPLEPIRVDASGNVRDYKSWEGYPILGAERLVISENTLPKNPDDDSTFLRLPRSHPLSGAGPGSSPIGVFQED
jgi:eukaryotic-like serine/threonine-protein kinase